MKNEDGLVQFLFPSPNGTTISVRFIWWPDISDILIPLTGLDACKRNVKKMRRLDWMQAVLVQLCCGCLLFMAALTNICWPAFYLTSSSPVLHAACC